MDAWINFLPLQIHWTSIHRLSLTPNEDRYVSSPPYCTHYSGNNKSVSLRSTGILLRVWKCYVLLINADNPQPLLPLFDWQRRIIRTHRWKLRPESPVSTSPVISPQNLCPLSLLLQKTQTNKKPKQHKNQHCHSHRCSLLTKSLLLFSRFLFAQAAPLLKSSDAP